MRGVLALASLTSWLGVVSQVFGAGEVRYPRGLASLVTLDWATTPAGCVALSALFVTALLLHACRVRPVLAGAVAFATRGVHARRRGEGLAHRAGLDDGSEPALALG
jgi:hypothetical protein